jgi:Zn-dependent protease with chaperone function
MQVDGYLYQQNSVKRKTATLFVDGTYYTLYSGKKKLAKGLINDLEVPSRIGNTSRKIQIDATTLFETRDNDTVDQLFFTEKNKGNWIHTLESKWRVAIPAIFIGIAFVGVFFAWGVPFAAKQIAYSIPEHINEKISQGSFEAIEHLMLEPSKLSDAKQQQISKRFTELVANYSHSKFHYKLHFRSMSSQANAFALPDGNIVITDTLIEYSNDEINEVLAVLLHEIGHVEERHSLRLALEASSTALIISMLTGDLSASDDLLITLPTILSSAAFSRQHEEEADDFALKFMQKANIDPLHFAHIMAKITQSEQQKDTDNTTKKEEDKHHITSKAEKIFSYISSHPVTEARIQKAETASKKFGETHE